MPCRRACLPVDAMPPLLCACRFWASPPHRSASPFDAFAMLRHASAAHCHVLPSLALADHRDATPLLLNACQCPCCASPLHRSSALFHRVFALGFALSVRFIASPPPLSASHSYAAAIRFSSPPVSALPLPVIAYQCHAAALLCPACRCRFYAVPFASRRRRFRSEPGLSMQCLCRSPLGLSIPFPLTADYAACYTGHVEPPLHAETSLSRFRPPSALFSADGSFSAAPAGCARWSFSQCRKSFAVPPRCAPSVSAP